MEKRLTFDPNAVVLEPQPIPPELMPGPDGRVEAVATFDNVGAFFNLVFGAPRIRPEFPTLSDKWAILFSETVHNLRSALDYLVYALAYLDSGQSQERTQFPVCTSPFAFENLVQDAKRSPVRGISKDHVAALGALQPYPDSVGLDPLWLARLADFSNADKHRHLTVVAPSAVTKTTWSIGTPAAAVQVDFEATYYVSLGDAEKTPLIPTLDSFVAHVTETLDAFRPEFKGQPT